MQSSTPINKKKRHFLFSLRAGIMVVFVSIFLIATCLIIVVTSLRFSRALLQLSNNLMTVATESITHRLDMLLQPATLSSKVAAELLQDKSLDANNSTQMMEYTEDLLRMLPQAKMVRWGQENGNFVSARRLADNTIETDIHYPSSTPNKRMLLSRDIELNIIKQEEIPTQDYDSRQRPWYLYAKQMQQTIWTNAYVFYWGEPGISSATPVYENGKLLGVFSVDIQLDSLSAFLATHKISEHGVGFIVDNNGAIIALSGLSEMMAAQASTAFSTTPQLINISDLSNKSLNKAYLHYQRTDKNKFTFQYQGKKYLASFQDIPLFKQYGWHIGIVVPESDFLAELQHYNLIIMVILSVVLLIGLGLISLFSKLISIPIQKLAEELDQIKLFSIDPNLAPTSYIKEVSTMSQAIESMKVGLRAFRQYVPENLVRQLVVSGEAATIGGHSRAAALFFSDIENFTGIAEQVGPEKIMAYLCDYFNQMSQVVTAHHGTIDKYMGDSIMAFWGAPLLDENSAQHACDAALMFQEKLATLNQQWQQTGKVAFPTRIGIHYGNVIIGNLGSSERMNYTAIGDSVNVANRLEELNKFYGTKIIVSENIRNQVNDQFLFRILDRIVVKGKTTPSSIYELIQSKKTILDDGVLEFCLEYLRGFTAYQYHHWDKAIMHFQNALQIFPHDHPSKIMIERCHSFKKTPPADDWNGIWLHTTKE